MVYCGKPSKSCHACRAKKTRCDAKPSGCTQCARTNRICPGYRAEVDLLFRDQSANVIQKAKAREAQVMVIKAPSCQSTLLGSECRTEHAVNHEVTLPPIFNLSPTLEERALGYFVSNYVVGIHVPGEGFLDNLGDLYRSGSVDETLVTSVKAVGLAGFAHRAQSTKLANSSRYEYFKAVQLTNAALRSPTQATKDSTLVAITILGLYELLTGSSQQSLSAWAEHVRGAAALIKLRGKNQFKTPTGRRLFAQCVNETVTTCLQRDIRVPDHIVEMTQNLYGLSDHTERALKVMLVVIEVNQFRAAVIDGTIFNEEAIVRRALELDGELQSFCESYPPSWLYHDLTVRNDESGLIFNERYHHYPDLWTGNIWNGMRIIRVLLHSRIRETLLSGFSAKPPIFTLPEHAAQFQRSTDVCYDMQADILASVPQYLGYIRRSTADVSSKPHVQTSTNITPYVSPVDFAMLANTTSTSKLAPDVSFDEALHNGSDNRQYSNCTRPVPDANGYALLWPLWVAGDLDLASEDARSYCVRTLQRIGNDMGIKQALMLARAMESRTEISFRHAVTEDAFSDDM